MKPSKRYSPDDTVSSRHLAAAMKDYHLATLVYSLGIAYETTFADDPWNIQPPRTARDLLDARNRAERVREMLKYAGETSGYNAAFSVFPEVSDSKAVTKRLRSSMEYQVRRAIQRIKEAWPLLLESDKRLLRAALRGLFKGYAELRHRMTLREIEELL